MLLPFEKLIETWRLTSQFYILLGKKAGDFIRAGACIRITVKILKFGTPQTIAIIVLKKEKFDVTLH